MSDFLLQIIWKILAPSIAFMALFKNSDLVHRPVLVFHLLLQFFVSFISNLLICFENLWLERVLINDCLDRLLLILPSVRRNHIERLMCLLLQVQPWRHHDLRCLRRRLLVLNVGIALRVIVLECLEKLLNGGALRILLLIIFIDYLNIVEAFEFFGGQIIGITLLSIVLILGEDLPGLGVRFLFDGVNVYLAVPVAFAVGRLLRLWPPPRSQENSNSFIASEEKLCYLEMHLLVCNFANV